ncbi:MAG TPA: 4'-phosphopantetheinyl transferase superfamily protein [Hyphomicrobium sp.]|nr:4'-phosphopantetheinyl transferase superfamily protein [Hyphomicrobium sp.]
MSTRPVASVSPLPDTALELWLIDLDEMAGPLSAAEADCARLSPDEEERACVIPAPAARQHWRNAHIALRLLLERWGGAGLRTQPFEVASGGRPWLPAPAPHFSLSHAGSLALVGLTRIAPLGVDIEPVSARAMPAERRARIVNFANEISGGVGLKHLDGRPLDASGVSLMEMDDAAFIQAWCRVEAFAKADGRGLLAVLYAAGVMGPAGKPGAGAMRSGSALIEGRNSVQGASHGVCSHLERSAARRFLGVRTWDVPLGAEGAGYRAAVALARGARISSDALVPQLLVDLEAAGAPLMRQAAFVLSPPHDGG